MADMELSTDAFVADSAGYWANHMARLFHQALAERIAPLGLAPGQFMVLLALWRGDGVTQKELITVLDVEQATLANTLSRMERDGLIERLAVENDRRARTIWLTEKAKALQAEALLEAKQVNDIATEGMSEEDRYSFVRLMKSATSALRASRAERAEP